MKIIADTHTHTLACDHAYSTLIENCNAAADKGLKILCATEHTPRMVGGPSEFYFGNLKTLPREYSGVTIVRGAELNIMTIEGDLDLPTALLKRLEWAIASLHTPCITPLTKEDHTQAWLSIAENPLVDCIGHCGDPRYPFDYEVGIRAFKKHGKVVEINAHSFDGRPGSYENCVTIAKLCKQYEVPVVASSDAHFATQIGEVQPALELLSMVDFPEELILNTDVQRFAAHINKINNKEIFKSTHG